MHCPLDRHCIHCFRIFQNSQQGFVHLVILIDLISGSVGLEKNLSCKNVHEVGQITFQIQNSAKMFIIINVPSNAPVEENAQHEPHCP